MGKDSCKVLVEQAKLDMVEWQAMRASREALIETARRWVMREVDSAEVAG